MTNEITKFDDTIDSRDVIARIDELREMRDDEDDDFDDEARAELAALESLAEEAEDYAPDWKHGETLIRDSYFKTYAQELADECGMIPDGAAWPLTCIDWDQAARELRMDYTSVEFNGVTYWIR